MLVQLLGKAVRNERNSKKTWRDIALFILHLIKLQVGETKQVNVLLLLPWYLVKYQKFGKIKVYTLFVYLYTIQSIYYSIL